MFNFTTKQEILDSTRNESELPDHLKKWQVRKEATVIDKVHITHHRKRKTLNRWHFMYAPDLYHNNDHPFLLQDNKIAFSLRYHR